MAIIVHPMNQEDWRNLYDFSISIHVDGRCYAFAIALHKGLGWQIVGIMSGKIIRHAMVRSPDGRYLDARGYVVEKDLGKPFDLSPPYILQDIDAKDLGLKDETGPYWEPAINTARHTAEALWPELPWKSSLAQRTRTFLEELEELSRKHCLWIRSPVPGARPVLAIGEGDEGGYSMQNTADGITFTIDRFI